MATRAPIHIKPSHRGLFTQRAHEHGKAPQAFAREVLNAPKGRYSSGLREEANFARNFGGKKS